MIKVYSQEIVKKQTRVPQEILMLQLMEKYGRTYEEYMNTPQYVINLIIQKNEIDYKLSKLNNGSN